MFHSNRSYLEFNSFCLFGHVFWIRNIINNNNTICLISFNLFKYFKLSSKATFPLFLF